MGKWRQMMRKKEWMSFEEAREYARGLGLIGKSQWRNYCKGGLKLENIPNAPRIVYKDKWLGFEDFLGYVCKKQWMPFEEAREFIRSLDLKSDREWRDYCKLKIKPENIPVSPSIVYKNDGWKDIKDWLGYHRVKRYKKYDINHNFFKVWSHDMAYVLGFWWADGWIRINKKNNLYHFCIAQNLSRIYILEKMLEKMGSTHPIITLSNNNCYFAICSKDICEDIVLLGGKTKKSLDVKFPNIPKEFLPDFIRGYFDGDGCIYKYKLKTKNKSESKFMHGTVFTSASKLFIDGLLDALRSNIENFGGRITVKNKINQKISKIKNIMKNGDIVYKDVICRHLIYRLISSINDSRRLKKYMYNGSDLMLIEKFIKFEDIGEIKNEYIAANFLSFEEAKNMAKKLGINSGSNWKGYARKNKQFPMCPDLVYRKYWINWKDFLGKK